MTISAQIQFIPLHSDSPMDRVDEAIAIIQASGVRYSVGPFGTSVEGEQDEINELVTELQNLKTTREFLLNVQYHLGENRLSNEEKVAKFQ
ncbi:MAG: thiamine-binding protein [Schleiferiaceae bacterium]|nr:thiamine-binding protein [Schleiferiaceae bacterium]